MLEEETRRADVRKGDFSVILVDFANYGDLIRVKPVRSVKLLIRSVVDEIKKESENKAHVFQYKDDSQIAIIYPHLDSDGVSLFCLETLERVNGGDWEIDGESVDIEAVVGFSVFSGDQTSDAILEAAETLLEMQKL